MNRRQILGVSTASFGLGMGSERFQEHPTSTQAQPSDEIECFNGLLIKKSSIQKIALSCSSMYINVWIPGSAHYSTFKADQEGDRLIRWWSDGKFDLEKLKASLKAATPT